MKKKFWIVLAIIVLLILTIPIPISSARDGGTKQYAALTYKIVDWNHLYDNGEIYDDTEIYLFPLNFNTVDELWERKMDMLPNVLSESNTKTISNCTIATFEYKDDSGYKLITSEIDALDTFDSLRICPTQEIFYGEWIYRIVFDPETHITDGDKCIILFGEKNLSINGITYEAEEGVDYLDILNWASSKYKFFDYELQTN